MDENCIFCKIIKGEIPSYKVYEGYQFSSEPIEYGYKFIGWYDENGAVKSTSTNSNCYHAFDFDEEALLPGLALFTELVHTNR